MSVLGIVMVVTTDKGVVVIQPDEELTKLYEAWRSAERGSSREAHLWTQILEHAQEAIDEDSDAEILDVAEGVGTLTTN